MLLSVIMTVYNSEKYVEYALNSVINQTYKKWELICVDDGSNDKSSSILDEYSKKDLRIKVIHKKNEGVSKARNVGLELAKGDIISFIDSDDYVLRNTYETIIEVFKNQNVSTCVVDVEKVHDFSLNEQIAVARPQSISFFDLIDLMNNCNSGVIGGVVNKFYRKQIIKNIRFDEDIYINEDMLFNCRVLRECTNILYIKVPFYKYYVANQASASKNVFFSEKGLSKLKSGVEAYNRMLSLSENKIPLLANQAIMYMNILLIMCDLKIDDRLLESMCVAFIRKRLRIVLSYDGIDRKHKATYFIACLNYRLALHVKKIGKKIMKIGRG